MIYVSYLYPLSLEGNPFIIRFKTPMKFFDFKLVTVGLEGNPFIIRFKTKVSMELLNLLEIWFRR